MSIRVPPSHFLYIPQVPHPQCVATLARPYMVSCWEVTSVSGPRSTMNVTSDLHWSVPDPDSASRLESGPVTCHNVSRSYRVSHVILYTQWNHSKLGTIGWDRPKCPE